MNHNEFGTDMTNPEHRAIECSAYIGAGGKLVIGTKDPNEWLDSDTVMALEDAAELTDEAYTRTLEGSL